MYELATSALGISFVAAICISLACASCAFLRIGAFRTRVFVSAAVAWFSIALVCLIAGISVYEQTPPDHVPVLIYALASAATVFTVSAIILVPLLWIDVRRLNDGRAEVLRHAHRIKDHRAIS